MSIEYSEGDLFESGCQALVCPVNCVGVMGKGLALEFKKRYPDMFSWYEVRCDRQQIIPRVCQSFGAGTKNIILFPTKGHWRDPSRLIYIEGGLQYLRKNIGGTPSIAVPALGCGLGGLQWSEVQPLIEKYLGDLDCRVVVFPPKEAS